MNEWITLLESLLALLKHSRTHKGTLTMSVVTTDDFAVRVRPFGTDVDGVKTDAPSGLTVTLDKPDQASVTPDDANPGAYLVKRLPATDATAGALQVVLTATDPATGVTATLPIEFDPGKETSLGFDTELLPAAA